MIKEIYIMVAGSIIGELSEKIPTSNIALNELIKNAYDAKASNVKITLDSTSLVISDDGNGMNEKEIMNLLQISKSAKTYGKKHENRYVQGSKGLGFLSVFKFGKKVRWETTTDKKRIFEIDYNKLLKSDNIPDFKIDLKTEEKDIKNGTTIKITDTGRSLERLKQDLNDEINRDKILNSFIIDKNDEFKITLTIDEKQYETKNISIEDYHRDSRLFHVSYDSEDKKIRFDYQRNECDSKNKITIEEYDIKSTKYNLKIDLMIFSFVGKRKTNDENEPTKLFVKHKSTTGRITPLIYINKTLFENYTLFDPEITRDLSNNNLPQIIGYIEIISDNPELQFNSDRTRFQENDLTRNIEEELQKMNKFIQKKGFEINKLIEEEKQKETESNSNKSSNIKMQKLEPPGIKLKQENAKYKIPSDPIDLRDCITKAVDNNGKDIKSKVQIKINGRTRRNGILQSALNPETKIIRYQYGRGENQIIKE